MRNNGQNINNVCVSLFYVQADFTDVMPILPSNPVE